MPSVGVCPWCTTSNGKIVQIKASGTHTHAHVFKYPVKMNLNARLAEYFISLSQHVL